MTTQNESKKNGEGIIILQLKVGIIIVRGCHLTDRREKLLDRFSG